MAPRVSLVRGDITAQQVDAIVNAANGSLMGGGGVDGAIHRRGGRAILDACKELRHARYPDGLPTGQAVATTGGDLPARWVIHTVGPVYAMEPEHVRLLVSCHVESLRVADELGARTVAFPAISTGVYGYPIEEAATVALASIAGAETHVDEVTFVLFGDDAHDVFARAEHVVNERFAPPLERRSGWDIVGAIGELLAGTARLSPPTGR